MDKLQIIILKCFLVFYFLYILEPGFLRNTVNFISYYKLHEKW